MLVINIIKEIGNELPTFEVSEEIDYPNDFNAQEIK